MACSPRNAGKWHLVLSRNLSLLVHKTEKRRNRMSLETKVQISATDSYFSENMLNFTKKIWFMTA